ncbi:hypothetical protein ACHQM5_016169 [Ranunculus cassubicifolius]
MANPGVGSKFVSVNLNKSYGQRSGGGGNRVRSGASGNGVGGGNASGGGMVVLSRSRSSIVGVQKGGPKLSVPPPLNLPSLRKEHEKYDSSSSGGGAAGAGNSGPGARPSSSGMSWIKPAPVVSQEKEIGNDHPLFERAGVGSPRVNDTDSSSRTSRTNSVYMPPSARSGPSIATPTHDFPPMQRAVVLRGEDFPSLQATLPTVSGGAQKPKDNLNQKQNQKASDVPDEHLENSYLRPPSGVQNQSSHLVGQLVDDKNSVHNTSGGSRTSEQSRKQADFFPSPFPLVRYNHTSDWADDERDTGRGITYHDRDQGYSRSEFPWDRDFDFPRTSVLPRTSNFDHSGGRGLRNDEIGRPPSGGFVRGNTYNRDIRSPSNEGREGTSWRAPAHVKDGFNGDRDGIGARPFGMNRENSKDTRYGQSPSGDSARDGYSSGFSGNQDSRFGRRDMGYGQGNRHTGNNLSDSYIGRGSEQSKPDPYGGNFPNRHRGESFQNGSFAKTVSKGHFVNDPVFNVSRDKRATNGKQYMEDPFLKDFGAGSDFDGRDPLTGSLVGVLKRKKDVLKQNDFHDPARESFEAELERVQKLQEQERQRVIEEQARAMEIARKEEEERERIVREEEERRRRLEEEAREAAWRAEQERLEAVRRAEEQRVAREEERRRMLLEEERRKEAARKKLLELEERIARRQAEIAKESEFSSTVRDEKLHGTVQEKEFSKVADVVDWEDGERMVERITSSASSDSSSLNRSFEMSSRPHFYGDGDPAFMDRGKPPNSWRRDVFDNGNSSSFIWQDQDSSYRSPKRDAYGAGRSVARKEHGGPGYMPTKSSVRGVPEHPVVDNLSYQRSNRWNLGRDEDPYSRNADVDPEFHDNFGDRFSDVGWGMGRTRASHNGTYPERPYQHSDTDGFTSFGKSRHSMRQPRVLPPPSMTSMNKNTFRSQIEPPASSAFLDSEVSYDHAPRTSEPSTHTRYEASYSEEVPRSRLVDSQKENTSSQVQTGSKTATSRCDSQSSLSVSSPPTSPTHLSHDDMEDPGELPVLPTDVEGEEVQFSDNEHAEVSTSSKLGASSSISPMEDDEWDVDNHQGLIEQEEYDEEENGYREEDEVHELYEEDVNLPQEFEDMHLEDKDQVVSSLDKSVVAVMPTSNDSEGGPINGERTVELQHVSGDVLGEAELLDSSRQKLHSGNDSPKINIESTSVIQETERSFADVDNSTANALYSSDVSAGLMDNIEASSTTTLTPQQHPSSSVDMALSSSSTQPTLSTVSAGPSQSEVPVKLQFGLFSGPSLIPSPVPAIQIGSIQMPLNLHHQGPPLTQMHTAQPPFFQFGQLRYASSPISQGLLPLGPQAMSFVQPSVPNQYPFNQNQDSPLMIQEKHDTSTQNPSARDREVAVSLQDHGGVQKLKDQSLADPSKEPMVSHSRADPSRPGGRNIRSGQTSHIEPGYQYFDGKRKYRSNVKSRESQSPFHSESSTSQFISKAPGPVSGNRGKRGVYAVKNSGPRSSFPVSESLHTDSRGFQKRSRPKIPRTEFRVRENVDKRQTEFLASSNHVEFEKSSLSGRVSGTDVQSEANEAIGSRQMIDAEGMNSESITAHDEGGMEIQHQDEAPVKKVTSKEGSPKTGFSFDEDVDAPLQSGIVRVFKQPGIEAPSDDDDFIEVRSKRQMLNDRREQREKEIKAMSRVVKAPRRRSLVPQNNASYSNSHKTSSQGGASNKSYSKSAMSHGQNLERSTRFTNTVISPPLAPIGTPSMNSDVQADKRTHTTKSPQTGSGPVISTNGTSLLPSLSFENKNMFSENVPTSLNPWGNSRCNQQVMALTQTQLDEAMKPVRFEKHVTSVIEPNKHSSSIGTPEKSFSSTASPLNSLLAGEKIQFGAVTSPTILPPSSRVTSNGLSGLENDCSLFYDKEKHLNESCVDLGDSEAEAEAEAAASAVAVAAISSDEIVGRGCSVSVSETKSFEGGEKEGLTSEGGASDQQMGSQIRVEESLSVALPADLSVETPALSLWPSLPSPQHSSGQMLSHFPGGPPSHFPCYEMNPMLGPPIFAYAPHDEAAQSQSQKSSVPVSGPLGAWQQCHSGVDSFYGPPAGFTGPFISPSGGIQGPPHMVVYNHFTPVGQFGQVGLSFMGATYIPSGKQPDWKHIPASSSVMGPAGGDANNNNNGGTNVPQIQHLAPGSPLMPMPMFDMSPYQASEAARWSHYSGTPVHPMPMPIPEQRSEGVVMPSQFSHGSTMDQSSGSRFHESYSSAPPSDNTIVTQFPDELGLTETSTTTTTSTSQVSAIRPSAPPVSYSSAIQSGGSHSISNSSSSSNTSNQMKTSSSSTQQQYLHSTTNTGYSQKSSEWGGRSRMGGYQGRNQSSSGTDKKAPHSKVKQIYVAKTSTSNGSS